MEKIQTNKENIPRLTSEKPMEVHTLQTQITEACKIISYQNPELFKNNEEEWINKIEACILNSPEFPIEEAAPTSRILNMVYTIVKMIQYTGRPIRDLDTTTISYQTLKQLMYEQKEQESNSSNSVSQ